MSKKIFLLDFNDSYTFNIVAQFYHLQKTHVTVVSPKNHLSICKLALKNPKNYALILGPGPGHPGDYPVSALLPAMEQANIATMGICLGHQMIGSFAFQGTIEKSQKPMHGQQEVLHLCNKMRDLLKLRSVSSYVQRYNSLALRFSQEVKEKHQGLISAYNQWDECQFLVKKNFYSLQFHPESIGTEHQSHYFHFALRFFSSI
jgi:anthranilate/para-aminobenzoate synthase component II